MQKPKTQRLKTVFFTMLLISITVGGAKLAEYTNKLFNNVNVGASVCGPPEVITPNLLDVSESCDEITWQEITSTEYGGVCMAFEGEYYLSVSTSEDFENNSYTSSWIRGNNDTINENFLEAGNTYYYRVKMRDPYIESESNWSNTLSCTIPEINVEPDSKNSGDRTVTWTYLDHLYPYLDKDKLEENQKDKEDKNDSQDSQKKMGKISLIQTVEDESLSFCENIQKHKNIPRFEDSTDHWAKEYIRCLQVMKVVEGRPDEQYYPNQSVNRAEITKIALLTFGHEVKKATKKPFIDVELNQWFSNYIYSAKNAGIVHGYYNKNFLPSKYASRAEVLKVLLEASSLDISIAKGLRPKYTDLKYNAWYMPYIQFAAKYNLLTEYPDGSIKPNQIMTRGETAKLTIKIKELEIGQAMIKKAQESQDKIKKLKTDEIILR